jgi:hypothetical protein
MINRAKYLLLIIGILALFATVYSYINGSTLREQLLGLVCGVALIYGYYIMHKAQKP